MEKSITAVESHWRLSYPFFPYSFSLLSKMISRSPLQNPLFFFQSGSCISGALQFVIKSMSSIFAGLTLSPLDNPQRIMDPSADVEANFSLIKISTCTLSTTSKPCLSNPMRRPLIVRIITNGVFLSTHSEVTDRRGHDPRPQ